MIPVLKDQVAQGLSRNIDFLDKENFNKLLTLFLEKIQEIEDSLLELAEQKNLFVAKGIWLDNIGKIIGESRKGRSDNQYRDGLLLKIAINSSDGTPDTIIKITKQRTGSDSSKIIEYHPAAFVNVITSSIYSSFVGYGSLVDSIKPAATNAIIVNNINGDRFTPAWRIGTQQVSGIYDVHVGLSTGGTKPLFVNDKQLITYATVFSSGSLIGLDYSYLHYKGAPNPTYYGMLAQRIYNTTTSIFTALVAETFSDNYFATAPTLEVNLTIYPE